MVGTVRILPFYVKTIWKHDLEADYLIKPDVEHWLYRLYLKASVPDNAFTIFSEQVNEHILVSALPLSLR